MKPENAIEVRNVTKSFKIYTDKGHTLKEKVLFSNRRTFEVRKVIDGISFDVKKGEAVGLIGHNGCGKSTTLKMLTRIMYPDSGTIEMSGRVSSLIELGAGFHPDMSGRDNIYINASIFGLTKGEIDEKVEDIIAFSELEDFIDNPVRTYSSGMYMRLAFAVAINVNAEILLIDEILGVGDVAFQEKCFNKLREIKASGTTIVIVSHSLGQIEQICERSIWIHEGKIHMEGKPREVHPEYLEYMGEKRQESDEKERVRQEEKKHSAEKENDEAKGTESEKKLAEDEEKKRWGNGNAKIQLVRMLDNSGKDRRTFKTGQEVTIEIEYEVSKEVKDAIFGIGIFRIDGVHCYGTNTRIDKLNTFDLTKNGQCKMIIDSLELLPGEYLLDVAIECGTGIPVDYCREMCKFSMTSAIGDVGTMRLEHCWKV